MHPQPGLRIVQPNLFSDELRQIGTEWRRPSYSGVATISASIEIFTSCAGSTCQVVVLLGVAVCVAVISSSSRDPVAAIALRIWQLLVQRKVLNPKSVRRGLRGESSAVVRFWTNPAGAEYGPIDGPIA